ncbi:M14 family metallopeptidase [Rossellomorea aquimaris]|jgi:murein tripeptide amidase MpaA|uniref:Carboxypeptidase n=1 Tax=Rossellomorea aquimaris TaxID=189382 RepID=A0A5D4TVP6_9BACI|nr:M14 family metallopeptidase [Rossellomorea aquimaris]TYS79001.1 carboxypeptidase [Rossellomorea aquimaris]TYS84746.1 carboxypeptidase [Rossellomorea aquimaris]
MKKKLMVGALSGVLVASGIAFSAPGASVLANGPGYNGNETIKNERLHNYEEMVSMLQHLDQKSDALSLEVYGQSVKGRDLYLAKFGTNENNPTILYLTQQHGNETLTTEGALQFIKHLTSNSKEVKEMLENVNILVAPRLNVDGAEGDVNFSLEDYVSGTHTRYNANEVDLNRDHVDRLQPETQALHGNVLQKYKPDYMIDLHHQGAETTLGDTDELVSGSILYPTNEEVDPEVVEKSKQLGTVLYNTVESRGFGTLSKYIGGTAPTISRNGLAVEYGIATLLFEMRGMADHYRDDYVLGQKSNGYLIKQAVISLEATAKAIADGSIENADTSFWDTLPESSYNRSESE